MDVHFNGCCRFSKPDNRLIPVRARAGDPARVYSFNKTLTAQRIVFITSFYYQILFSIINIGYRRFYTCVITIKEGKGVLSDADEP